MREIFDKKVDVSRGAICRLFLLPWFGRKRETNVGESETARRGARIRLPSRNSEPESTPLTTLVHHLRINNVPPPSFFPFHSLRGALI